MSRKSSMTRAILFALLLAALSGTALAAAPGCDANGIDTIWGAMQRRTDALRVRDKAYTPIIRQNDSVLAVTCFDKAVALTSRLGAIFSDLPAGGMAAPDIRSLAGQAYGTFADGSTAPDPAAIATNVYNTFGGMAGIDPLTGNPVPNTLANVFNDVVGGGPDGQLSAYLQSGGFAESLSDQLGATVTGALDGLSTSIAGQLNTAGTILSTLNDYANVNIPGNFQANLSVNMGALGSVTLNVGLGDFGGPLATITSQLASVITAAQTALGDLAAASAQVQAAAQTYRDQITDLANAASALGGAAASLSGLDWGAAGVPAGCLYSGQMWKAAAASTVKGLTGKGPEDNMPFFTLDDLITQNVAGLVPGTGMARELGTALNQDILAIANYDQSMLLLSPDTTLLRSWALPPPVAIEPLTRASDIISVMP